MNRTIKHLIATTALAGSLLFAGMASAESLIATPNASAQVTFYNADPATGTEALASATVNNSPSAVTIEGIDGASYATVTFEGESYTFALTDSGKNKNEVVLELADTGAEGTSLVSDIGTLTLTELLDGLAANSELLEQLQGGTQVS